MKRIVLLAFLLLLGKTTFAQVVETTVYDDGRVYTGQRDAKGKINGKGLMIWPNGDRYDGYWKKGIMHGEGTYTYAAAGYSYSGEWKKGEIKGHGVFKFANGNMMEGDWTDMGTGTGYMLMADGTRYDGPFVNGRFQGSGILVWTNGNRYEGTFVDGHMQGYGTLKMANGEEYKGMMSNDRREGNGTVVYPDGSNYEGEWHNDLPNGRGKYINAQGEEFVGQFIDGNFVPPDE
ncbi:MAG: hypothetical protein J6W88_03205 [Bacteroidales bacterium]|nr:hypothetical protein [Bacteroidales bacterium]